MNFKYLFILFGALNPILCLRYKNKIRTNRNVNNRLKRSILDSEILNEKWIEQDLDHFNKQDRRTWKMVTQLLY